MSASRPGARPAVEKGCSRASIMAFVMAMTGVVLQLFEFWYTGISVVVIAFWLVYDKEWRSEKSLYYRPALNSKPKEWKSATIKEFNRLVEKIDTVSDFNSTIFGKFGKFCSDNFTITRFPLVILAACAVVVAVTTTVLLFFGFTYSMLEVLGFNGADQRLAFQVVLANSIVLVVTSWFFFLPKIWTPQLVSFKLPHFHKLMQELPGAGMGDWTTEFQLELSKTDEGQMPTDIKMVIKPPEAPAEFYGVQAQISINMGGPYVYFVIVTKENLMIPMPSGVTKADVVEASTADGVNILVIRNHATKTAGYITRMYDIRRLLQLTKKAATATVG